MKTISNPVTRHSDSDPAPLVQLLSRFGLNTRQEQPGRPIAGSFWGDEEAGLVENTLVLRHDTPIHSILHEACHFICMDPDRRLGLHTNAGGDYDEENAVCYLQILLADEIPGFGRDRMMVDMDTWGYTFRLGSARAWFEQDSADAMAWLTVHGLISAAGTPTFTVRSERKQAVVPGKCRRTVRPRFCRCGEFPDG
jgi:hypothetical protein